MSCSWSMDAFIIRVAEWNLILNYIIFQPIFAVQNNYHWINYIQITLFLYNVHCLHSYTHTHYIYYIYTYLLFIHGCVLLLWRHGILFNFNSLRLCVSNHTDHADVPRIRLFLFINPIPQFLKFQLFKFNGIYY